MANKINVKLPPPAINCKTIKQVGQCNRWNLSDSGLFRKFAAASPSLHGSHGAQWKWKFHEIHPSRNVGLLEIGSQNRNMHSAGLALAFSVGHFEILFGSIWSWKLRRLTTGGSISRWR